MPNKGQFQKGKSGNPGGRPKEVGEVKELARQHTEAAISTLAKIMKDGKAPPNARVSAAEALLSRGYGRAPQTVDVNVRRSIGEFLESLGAVEALSEGDVERPEPVRH
jgi:predicted phage-related endonuclease